MCLWPFCCRSPRSGQQEYYPPPGSMQPQQQELAASKSSPELVHQTASSTLSRLQRQLDSAGTAHAGRRLSHSPTTKHSPMSRCGPANANQAECGLQSIGREPCNREGNALATACRSVELDVQRLAHIRASLHNIRSRHSSAMANNAGISPAASSAGGPRLQGAALPTGSGPTSHSTVLSGAAAGPGPPQSSTGSAAIRLPSAETRQRQEAAAELADSELPDNAACRKGRVAPEAPDAAAGPSAAQRTGAETGARLQQRAAWAMAQSSPVGGGKLSDSSIENHSYVGQPGPSLLRSVGSGAQGPPFASRDLNRQLHVSDLTTWTCS